MSQKFSEIVDSFSATDGGGVFVQKRIESVLVLPSFAAKKITTDLEALVLKIHPTLLPHPDVWPRSEGFNIEIRSTGDPKDTDSLVCLELSSKKFRAVFLSLAEDLIGILIESNTREDAIVAIVDRLHHWQTFLKKNRPDGLSEEQQMGLFGELSVLQNLILTNLDEMTAVKGWRGCWKGHQDFQFPDIAIETKTTCTIPPASVHISNIQQLENHDVGSLFLTVVCAHANETNGLSLPGIVAQVRDRLSSSSALQFNAGLINVGYLDSHQEIYESPLYHVNETRVYKVESDFPRLASSDIPNGVTKVKFQISLDVCEPFLTTEKCVSLTLKS